MPTTLPQNIEKELLDLLSDQTILTETIINYIKNNCSNYPLQPKILGMLFERYANPHNGYSEEITIESLLNIHPSFRSTNGNQWARTNSSWLGKKYNIVRELKNGSVYSIKLDGFNTNSIEKNRGIKQEIVNALKNKKCCILDVHSSKGSEIDHKNGRYDTVADKIEDFQVLSKAANDAKRQHCKECKTTGKRYDAKNLGYSESYITGNADTKSCIGCYWYDPPYFNSIISKDFNKDDMV